MKAKKAIHLLFTFYRSFWFFSLLVTLTSVFLFAEYGMPIFKVLFWFKLLSLLLTYYFISVFKKNELYYYRNLGMSKSFLWSVVLTSDFLLFILLIVLAYHVQ